MNFPPDTAPPPPPVLTGQGQAFHYSWRRFLLPYVLVATAVAPLGVPLGVLASPAGLSTVTSSFLSLATLGTAGAGLAYSLVSGVAVIYGLPTRVGAEGIRGQNLWGMPTFLSWEEIASANKRRVLGFPYLVLKGEGKGSVWLTLLLDDLPGLADLAREYGGDDHPLSRALAKER